MGGLRRQKPSAVAGAPPGRAAARRRAQSAWRCSRRARRQRRRAARALGAAAEPAALQALRGKCSSTARWRASSPGTAALCPHGGCARRSARAPQSAPSRPPCTGSRALRTHRPPQAARAVPLVGAGAVAGPRRERAAAAHGRELRRRPPAQCERRAAGTAGALGAGRTGRPPFLPATPSRDPPTRASRPAADRRLPDARGATPIARLSREAAPIGHPGATERPAHRPATPLHAPNLRLGRTARRARDPRPIPGRPDPHDLSLRSIVGRAAALPGLHRGAPPAAAALHGAHRQAHRLYGVRPSASRPRGAIGGARAGGGACGGRAPWRAPRAAPRCTAAAACHLGGRCPWPRPRPPPLRRRKRRRADGRSRQRTASAARQPPPLPRPRGGRALPRPAPPCARPAPHTPSALPTAPPPLHRRRWPRPLPRG
jgi:hypothetical protein